ncbi:hypothetical protein GCM10007422_00380 [Pedobacter zeae]|uniref:Cold shock CspA family protein n=1 Tax=Pedobacter zeae TaxID=1737356 RepID=A0A7W6KBB4_9SPHI|nr:cold shock CspA family protein [Pedobacter zeae]GGG91437.1 hypothetical protein GCM10007422_00380 [Pedobacter zeae]
MGDMRKGDVTQIDFESGLGIIIDENDQDIHFQLDNVSSLINLNSRVIFEIELHEHGLMAVNVQLEMEQIKI